MTRPSAATGLAVFTALCLSLSIGCRSTLKLEAEQPQTLRVGDVAEMRVETARHFAVGPAGDSLRLLRRAEEHGTTSYVYRAVAPGRHTFVLTPRDPGPDGCISCVTVHYFITVVR